MEAIDALEAKVKPRILTKSLKWVTNTSIGYMLQAIPSVVLNDKGISGQVEKEKDSKA